MPLTPPPEAPSTDDLENFDDEADAWLAYWALAVEELNALEENVQALADQVATQAAEVEEHAIEVQAAALAAADAAGYVARSTSTLAVGAGSKTIHFTVAKPDLAVLNERIVIVLASDPSVKMWASVATTDGSDDITATVVSGGVFGSGTYSNWLIIDAAFFAAACTAAELWKQETDAAAITPKTLKDAKVWVALTDAATVTPNGQNGRNFEWTIGADRTLGAITNCAPNDVFRVKITQNGTGGWDIAWASGVYKRVGGLPTLAQTAGQKTYLKIEIVSVDGSGTATEALVTVAANPTN